MPQWVVACSLLIGLCGQASTAQGYAAFDAPRSIYPAIGGPVVIRIADLDGDARPDVVVGAYRDGAIVWYRNSASGIDPSPLPIATGQSSPLISCVDLDGDQDLDLLAGWPAEDRVAWFRNDGAGHFAQAQQWNTWSVGFSSMRALGAADNDADGDADIYLVTPQGGVKVFANGDGHGQFETGQLLWPPASSTAGSVDVADLDRDGDLDLIELTTVSEDVGETLVITWRAQQTAGAFGAPRAIDRISTSVFVGPLVVGDVDNDHDIDLYGTYVGSDGHGIVLYRNDGVSHTFGRELRFLIGAPAVSRVHAVDYNGDGVLDLLGIGAYEVQATMLFDDGGAAGSTARMTMDPAVVAFGDLDGNGRQEIVYRDGSGVSAIGDGLAAGSQQAIVPTAASDPFRVTTADFDADGDPDLLIGFAGYGYAGWYRSQGIYWAENDGGGQFTRMHFVFEGGEPFDGTTAADLDGDGDLDIAVAGTMLSPEGYGPPYARMFWAENQGALGFDVRHEVASAQAYMYNIVATDLDADANVDLVAGGGWGLDWYQNGTGAGTLLHREIAAPSVIDLSAADLDGDGVRDLLAVTDYQCLWYKNSDGLGTTWVAHVLFDGGFQDPRAAAAADLDGDGDLDVVVVIDYWDTPDRVEWYENLDGAGTFGAAIAIDAAAGEPVDLTVGDVDGDADIDVVVATDTQVRVYENADGQATFLAPYAIALPTTTLTNLALVDLDGDGRRDVLYAAPNENAVAWLHNAGTDACPLDPLKTQPGLCGCGAVDQDSDLDGTLDCDDRCRFDANKTFPGLCGCGRLETDGCPVPDGGLFDAGSDGAAGDGAGGDGATTDGSAGVDRATDAGAENDAWRVDAANQDRGGGSDTGPADRLASDGGARDVTCVDGTAGDASATADARGEPAVSPGGCGCDASGASGAWRAVCALALAAVLRLRHRRDCRSGKCGDTL